MLEMRATERRAIPFYVMWRALCAVWIAASLAGIALAWSAADSIDAAACILYVLIAAPVLGAVPAVAMGAGRIRLVAMAAGAALLASGARAMDRQLFDRDGG